jgi:hypothetical protein
VGQPHQADDARRNGGLVGDSYVLFGGRPDAAAGVFGDRREIQAQETRLAWMRRQRGPRILPVWRCFPKPEVAVRPADYVEKIKLPSKEARVRLIDEAPKNWDCEVALMNAAILIPCEISWLSESFL